MLGRMGSVLLETQLSMEQGRSRKDLVENPSRTGSRYGMLPRILMPDLVITYTPTGHSIDYNPLFPQSIYSYGRH